MWLRRVAGKDLDPVRSTVRPMKDFSKARKKLLFRIDTDSFEAAPAIPAETLAVFATRFENIESVLPGDRFKILSDALELVLLPESYGLLRERMRDKTNPVELDQINDIILWLLEEYGLRPTQPSSASSVGQPNLESGTNLTGVQLPGESISTLFPATVS